MVYNKWGAGFFMPKICNSLASPINAENTCSTISFKTYKIINGVCSDTVNPDFSRGGFGRID